MATPPLPCPVCGADVTGQEHASWHVDWHASTRTLDGWTVAGALYALQQDADPQPRDEDLAQTAKLPPITETVRRRPPVPPVRELPAGSAELLRALADALDEDPDVDPGDVL